MLNVVIIACNLCLYNLWCAAWICWISFECWCKFIKKWTIAKQNWHVCDWHLRCWKKTKLTPWHQTWLSNTWKSKINQLWSSNCTSSKLHLVIYMMICSFMTAFWTSQFWQYVFSLIGSKQGHRAGIWFEPQGETECCRVILQLAREAQTHVSQSFQCRDSHCRHHIFTSSSSAHITHSFLGNRRNQASGYRSAPLHFCHVPDLSEVFVWARQRPRVSWFKRYSVPLWTGRLTDDCRLNGGSG